MKIKNITGILAALLVFAACGENKENASRIAARNLFEKSRELGQSYIDSMLKAKDSLTLISLSDRYEENLTKLNYEYGADTDLHISEGENDTLINLNHRFVNVRDSLLKRYAYLKLHPDTVSSLLKADSTQISTQK